MKRLIVAAGFALATVSTVHAEEAKTEAKTPAPAAEAKAELAPQVTLDELKKIVADKSATILDANSSEMFADGHVPGAIHYGSNEGKLASVLPKDKNAPLVAYCGGPMCTAWEFAAKEAMQLGYTNIKHYKGGIKGWKDAGQPVEKSVKKSS
jgi:rhodanese-related sulfurtransferase